MLPARRQAEQRRPTQKPPPQMPTRARSESIRVALGCLDVPMPHPHGNPSTSHRRTERVAQIVEAMRLLKLRGLERPAEAPQDRRLVERPGRVEIGEHESIALSHAAWLSRSSSPATSSAIGTLRVERRDFGVPNSPST